MRSGNKVSFKNMGSSPAKQSDEEIGLDTPEAKAIKERDLEKSKNNNYGEKRKNKTNCDYESDDRHGSSSS